MPGGRRGLTVGDVPLKYRFVLLMLGRHSENTVSARETVARSAEKRTSSAAAGREPMRPPGSAALSALAAEFPGYEFATQPKWGGGVAIVARRQGGCARPGLYVVISEDLDEMRRTLLEQERTQLPA